MAEWHDAAHVVWNGVCVVVLLSALLVILRDPVWKMKKGWWGRGLLLFFGLIFTFGVKGFILPFGPIALLVLLRHNLRRRQRAYPIDKVKPADTHDQIDTETVDPR